MPFEPHFLEALSDLGLKGLLLLAVFFLWKRLRETEDGRLEDSRKHADQVMVIARDFTEAIHKSAAAQQKTIDMLKERQRLQSEK
jgi:hypothetical protein